MHKSKLQDLTVVQITTFLSVASTLNMSRSAKELYVSQPTVSKRISEIETVFGFPLFNRTGAGLQLTEAGRYLAEELKSIYDRLEQCYYDADALDRGYIDTFTIYVDTLVGVKVLYAAVDEFRHKFPRVNLNIETDIYNVKEAIINEEVDLALSDYEPSGEYEIDLEYHFVKDYEVCAVIHKEHPLARKDIITLEDLEGQELIAPSADVIGPYDRIFSNMFRDVRTPPTFKRTVKSSRLEYQALFNKGIVLMIPETMEENSKEAKKVLDDKLKVYPLQYVMRSGFCWKRGKVAPLIHEFITIFSKYYRKKGTSA